MEETNPSSIKNKKLIQEGVMNPSQRTATCPKPEVFREVCREWLVIEDSALAHQLQDQEIAAHYGNNREKNRIVRGDVSTARTEQEDELKQALALQRFQQQLREQQEREDEDAARKLAEELEREEELRRRRRVLEDEKLALKLQQTATVVKRIEKPRREKESYVSASIDPLCSSMKMLDMNQPMSEEESREWQERCDAEMARKLQQEEEEESKFRRDVTDLGRKLAIEAKDLELAKILQEKEKARLRKAKEKARLKALQAQQPQSAYNLPPPPVGAFETESNRQGNTYMVPETQNIAASIDPTWSRRYLNPEYQTTEPGVRTTLPITDLDFPAPAQPILPGHRRTISSPMSVSPDTESPTAVDQVRHKSRKGCSHQ